MLDLTPVILVVGCSAVAPQAELQKAPVATIADLSAEAPAQAPAAAPVIPGGREKAIAAYRSYLERYPAAPARREVKRRLADLLLESAALSRTETSARGKSSAELASIASARYAEAIEIYETLLRQERDKESRSELRYQLARAYDERGEPARAMSLLTQLGNPPPGARATVYGDAQFRRAELLFTAKSFAEAEQAYRKAIALGEHTSVYTQSLYKLGWTLFKQGRYQDAVDVFFSLLDHKLPAGVDIAARIAGFSGAEQEQLADVFRALALCFSQAGSVGALTEYLAQHGGRSYEDRLYRSLGALYAADERYSDAAATYLTLARRAPLSADAPQLYLNVVSIYRQAGFANRIMETKAEFARTFAPDAAFWRQHAPASMPQIMPQVQTSMAELARHYHAEARQPEGATAYREAQRWYRAYLRAFGDSAQAAQMNFRLAELLDENGEYRQAASEFEQTAYSRGPHRLAADAGYRAVVARDQHQKTLTGKPQASWAQDSIAHAIRFLERFPTHSEAAAVLATTGRSLLDRKAYAEAIRVSQGLLQKPATLDPALRQQAAILLAEARFENGDYPAAERGYEAALQRLAAADPRRAKLRERLAASIHKQGQASLANNEARQAASQFLQASRAAPGSAIRPKALYDAAAALLTLEDWAEAAATLERFQQAYPKHPFYAQATQKLAYVYQRSGRITAAADAYLRVAQQPREAAVRRAALLQAADLYWQAGAADDAIAALERYLNGFPRPITAAIEVRQRLAQLAHDGNDEQRRRYWLVQVIEADRTAGAARNSQTREQAAQAALHLAEDSGAAFYRARLAAPLKRSLPQKLKLMKAALQALEQAADYGVYPVTTAATHQIGDLYYALSRELLASARPQHLAGEARAQYELMLAEQAFPFEEKAIHFYEANAHKIREEQNDPWIAKSLGQLAELVPARYAQYVKEK